MEINRIQTNKTPEISTKNDEIKTQSNISRKDGAKALSLSLAALATLGFTGAFSSKFQTAMAKPINQTSTPAAIESNLKIDDGNIKVDFIAPAGTKVDISQIEPEFNKAKTKLNELKSTDPNYSWVELPEKLLEENYVENVYKTVEEFKKPFPNNPKLIFVALGNPSNTDELVNALGLNNGTLTYSCDTTQAQIKDSIKKAGSNLGNIQVIISSKSGSTFESNQTYKLLTQEFTKYYESKGTKPEDIQKEISKHFLMITDKNPDKSKLKKAADEKGIKTIDALDGLHSAFGEFAYSMPILAYQGLPEKSAIEMLKAGEKANKELLDNGLDSNIAGKIAAFDKIAINNGATKEQFIFHDSHFTDFSSTMEQIYKESLRKINFTTSVYPKSAHSGLEADLSRELKDQPISIITNVNAKNEYLHQSTGNIEFINSAKNLEKAHEISAQKEGHFQKNISLNLGENGLTPESLAEFLSLKSFVAYYKNELENDGKLDLYKQSYVKDYKDIRVKIEKE